MFHKLARTIAGPYQWLYTSLICTGWALAAEGQKVDEYLSQYIITILGTEYQDSMVGTLKIDYMLLEKKKEAKQ